MARRGGQEGRSEVAQQPGKRPLASKRRIAQIGRSRPDPPSLDRVIPVYTTTFSNLVNSLFRSKIAKIRYVHYITASVKSPNTQVVVNRLVTSLLPRGLQFEVQHPSLLVSPPSASFHSSLFLYRPFPFRRLLASSSPPSLPYARSLCASLIEDCWENVNSLT
jgi:hypothetical protein